MSKRYPRLESLVIESEVNQTSILQPALLAERLYDLFPYGNKTLKHRAWAALQTFRRSKYKWKKRSKGQLRTPSSGRTQGLSYTVPERVGRQSLEYKQQVGTFPEILQPPADRATPREAQIEPRKFAYWRKILKSLTSTRKRTKWNNPAVRLITWNRHILSRSQTHFVIYWEICIIRGCHLRNITPFVVYASTANFS